MSQSRVACASHRATPATLVATILFALACAAALVAFAPGKALAYNIDSTDDFVEWLGSLDVGGDHGYLQADITITDDDLDRAGNPESRILGQYDELDGNGFTITLNLTRHSGLFYGVLGKVHDLQLRGSVSYDHQMVGALAGTVTTPAEVRQVVNFADVTGPSLVGGIAGTVTETAPRLDDEGRHYTPEIIAECANYGTITATDSKSEFSPVGGIAGSAYASGRIDIASAYLEIARCYNAGTVRGSSKSAAGIVGDIEGVESFWNGTEGHVNVYDCYNVGTIEGGNKDAAGIVAHTEGAANASSCYNAGRVTADNMKTAHGIVHWIQNDHEPYDCYSVDIGGIGWESGGQNGTVVSAEELRTSEDIRKTLGKPFISVEGVNQGYPVLDGVGEGKGALTLKYELVDNLGNTESLGEYGSLFFGDEAPLPTREPPELDGRTFQYWTAEAPNEDNLYDEPPKPYLYGGNPYVYHSLTLYTYYSLNPVTLKFNINLPEGVEADFYTDEMTVLYGRPYGPLPEPVSRTSGWNFDYWEDENGNYRDEDSTVRYVGAVQELKATWVEGTAYVNEQPADVAAALGAYPKLSFNATLTDKYQDSQKHYQWYWGYDPDRPETFVPVPEATESEFDPFDGHTGVHFQDGNTYFFCEAGVLWGYEFEHGTGKPIIDTYVRSRTACVSLDLGSQITAAVDEGNIKIDLSTAEETLNGYTYEYEIPVNITLKDEALGLMKKEGGAETVSFTVAIPDMHGVPQTFTHGPIQVTDCKAGEPISYTERVRLSPRSSKTAVISGFTVSENRVPPAFEGTHVSANLNEVTSAFRAPDVATVPASIEPTVLWNTGNQEYDYQSHDIWNPYGHTYDSESESFDVTGKMHAYADMTWEAGFDPKKSTVSATWEYSLDDTNWHKIEGAVSAIESRKDGDVWKTRVLGTIQPELLYNGARFRAVIGTEEYGATKTGDPSAVCSIDLTSPKNVTASTEYSDWATVEWDWDVAEQGMPTDGTEEDKGFLVTYGYTATSGATEWQEIDTVKVGYNEMEGLRQKTDLRDLQPGTEYRVMVQAYANKELSAASNVATFTTKGLPPGEAGIAPGIALAELGEPCTFQVVYNDPPIGKKPVRYQWQVSHDDVEWKDADNPNGPKSDYYNLIPEEGGPTYVRCIFLTEDGKLHTTPSAHALMRLSAPTNTEAAPQTYSAKLSWDQLQDAEDYIVRYTSSTHDLTERPQDPAWTYVKANNANEITIEGLKAKTEYHWQVTALRDNGWFASDWSECKWRSSGSEPGAFKTKSAANVCAGTWTLSLKDLEEPLQDYLKLGASSDERTTAPSNIVGEVTFIWQYRNAGEKEWHTHDYNNKTSGLFGRPLDTGAEGMDYGRSWRCVVSAETGTDSVDTSITNEVTPRIAPPNVKGLSLQPGSTTMDVSWSLLGNVDAYEITYGAPQGGGGIDKPTTIVVGSAEAGESALHYTVEGGTATYTLTDLIPQTDYRVKIVGCKLGEFGNRDTAIPADARTLSQPDYPVIGMQPANQFASVSANNEVTFSASARVPEDGGELSAHLERYVSGKDGVKGVWVKVADATVAPDPSVADIMRITAVLAPSDEMRWRYTDASKMRFVVTNTRDGGSASSYSEAAYLVILAVQPSVSVVPDSTTTTSVDVALEGTLDDGIAATNRFAVLWTDNASLSTADLSGWKRMTVDADDNGQATYRLAGLTPGTTYRIMAVSSPVVDGMTLPPSKPSEAVEITTVEKNPLTAVSVTPERTVAQEGDQVKLTATPVFDGDAAEVSYAWQQFSTGDGWQDAAGAPNAREYTVTAGATLADVYRCVVTAGGALNPDMEEKAVVSNRALVWTDKRPADPSSLSATAKARSAELTWTGDSDFAGSYLVEYRVIGADTWRTSYADASPCTIGGLEPSTTYEWRVTAQADSGLSSAIVDGPAFSTQAGSTLTEARLTPSETSVVMEGDWKTGTTKLSITDNAASDETKEYAWEYSDDGGASWTAVDGGNESYEAPVPRFSNNAGVDCVGTRQYRCTVTATAATGDDGARVTSSTAEVRLVPNVPTEACPKDTETFSNAATLTWKPPAPAVPCGYEVQYRKQGDTAWTAVAPEKIRVEKDGSRWCRIEELKPSTVYEWQVRAVGIPAGKDEKPDSKYATAWVDGEEVVTRAASGLTKAVVTPQVALFDPADTEKGTTLSVSTDAKDKTGFTYTWQWKYADGTNWNNAASGPDFSVNADKLTINPAFYAGSNSKKAHGARFQCVVKDGNGNEADNHPATLLSRLTAPYELEVAPESISMTGAGVTWKDDNPYKGSYTLEYRAVGQPVSISSLVAASLPGAAMLSGEQGLQTSIDPSGWIPVEGLRESKRYDFNSSPLEPGTTYEWRVKFVSDAGSTEGPVAYGPVFTTLSGSALAGAVATPKIAVDEVGKEVTFTVVTNVDGEPTETLDYQWDKKLRGSEKFEPITDETGKTLKVKVSDDDLGTQYRCVVIASKNDDTKKVTSTPASLWKRLDVTPPSKPKAEVQSALKAELSWECGAQVAGTYTVEYRAKDGAWQTVSGIADKKLALDGLAPSTTYEWRAAHVLGNGLASDFVPGPEFKTLEGSALASVTVTPSSATYTNPKEPPLLTVSTNELSAEEAVTYEWQLFNEPGPGDPREWKTQPNDREDKTTYKPQETPEYDTTLFRCLVTATKNGDSKSIASAVVPVTLAPEVPHDLYADEIGKDKAKLQWTQDIPSPPMSSESVDYEVAWRVQGEDAWKTANSRDSSASSGPWKKRGDGASFSLEGLGPSTAYEWRARATSNDATVVSEWSDISSFVTLGESGLSKAAVSPVLNRYDAQASPAADAVFKVYTDASAEDLDFQWQWKPQGGDWANVEDDGNFKTSQKGDELTVVGSFAKTKDAHASSYRCVVKTKAGTELREATSQAALLMHRMAEPANLDTRNVSTNSATLSWTDANQYEGIYTLRYRKAPVATAAMRTFGFAAPAASDGWTTIEGIARNSSGTTTYTLDRLDPGTAYDWQVMFKANEGGFASDWAEGERFATLPGSALNRAEVSPPLSVRDPGEAVELKVVTNVDNALDERREYRWQKAERGSDQWNDVPNARDAALSVTVGDADWGVRYRCMVKATKSGNSTELASNEAVIWSSTALAAPRDLAVSGISPTGAKLSWACDAPVKGTYTVEYRAKGTDTWTVVEGLTAPELSLNGLSPETEYEWQVAHVVTEGLVSETVPGPNFTTLAPGEGGGSGGGAAAKTLAPSGDPAPVTALAASALLAFLALLATGMLVIRRRRS